MALDLRITCFYNRPEPMRDELSSIRKGASPAAAYEEEVPMPGMKKRAKKATKSKPMRKSKMAKKKPAKKTKKK
jgi:hypothetical protein